MGLVENRMCDGCGAVVSGLVGTKRSEQNSFEIRGTVVLQLRKNYPSKHVFISKERDDYLIFCLKEGLPCLQQYIDRRRASWQFKNRSLQDSIESDRDAASRDYLRKEAEKEYAKRVESGEVDTE